MIRPTDARYFDQLWAASPDPWEHEYRFSETRKYDLTVSALDRLRYRRGFEPGCGIGRLTERLARRCDELVAWDRAPRATEVTRDRLGAAMNVAVEVGDLGHEFPDGSFDLFVFSEILYYFTPEQLVALAERVDHSAEDHATLLAVHYRPLVPEHALRGDAVHELVQDWSEWVHRGGYLDDDVRLDLWTR